VRLGVDVAAHGEVEVEPMQPNVLVLT
jgi:hypothetical protein